MINVCLFSFSKKTLSIGAVALSESEFNERVYQLSGRKINVSYLLGSNNHTSNPKYIKRFSNRKIPQSLNNIEGLIQNIPFLLSQDILVAPGIDAKGFIISAFCKLFRKKSIITVHGHMYDEMRYMEENKSKLYSSLISFFVRCTLKYASLLVPINEKIRDELVLRGADPEKISLRYIFADTNKFSRKNINLNKLALFKKKYEIPETYLLFVGYYHEKDSPLDALKVYNKVLSVIPDIKLVMVGDYEYDNKYKKKVDDYIQKNKLTKQVIQIKGVKHDEMPFVFFDASICIITARPPGGGVGKIRLEALSMEVPTIIYDLPAGYNIIIDDYSGYRIPIDNIDFMSEKVISLLQNEKMRKIFGKNGRALVKEKNDIVGYLKN